MFRIPLVLVYVIQRSKKGRVFILTAPGFEEADVSAMTRTLRRSGLPVAVVGPAAGPIQCLEHYLDAVYLQKVSAGFSGHLQRQRRPAVAKSIQIGLLRAEINHLAADCCPKSGRGFFDVIWAAKHSL